MGLLFKFLDSSVEGKLTEDPRNFSQAPAVIIKNVGGKLNVSNFLDTAQKVFPAIKMAQVESEDFKNCHNNLSN